MKNASPNRPPIIFYQPSIADGYLKRRGNGMTSRNKREGWYEGKPRIFEGVAKRHKRSDRDHSLRCYDLEFVECRGCDRMGFENADGGFYCGSSPRCCP